MTEVDLRGGRLRAYTTDRCKLDLVISGADERLINMLSPGRVLDLDARITRDRRDFYDQLLARLGSSSMLGDNLVIDGVELKHPEYILNSIFDREYFNWRLGPVHGDLHSGNILYGAGNFGVIDYGKMRQRFPVLYDIAYLVADLKSKYVSARYAVHDVAWLEERLGRASGWLPFPRRKAELHSLALFEYEAFRPFIGGYGDPDLYHALLAGIYLGRLKFNLTEHEQKVCLTLANYAWSKVAL